MSLQGLTEDLAAAILEAGWTPRAKVIDTLQRYEDGSVYDGRPSFFDDTSTSPVTDRKPCVQYLAVRNAIRSHVTMCLGEGRFPALSSAPSEDDSAFDDRFGLNEPDSKTLDAGVAKIVVQTRLDTAADQILASAMASKSVAVLVSILGGKLRVACIDAKTCEPEFDEDNPERVKRLVVSYRYTRREVDPVDHKWKLRAYQYRRVVDETFDTVFAPVEIEAVTEFPVPSVEKTKYRHGFGFCPVVWYKFMAPIAIGGSVDGLAIHEAPGTRSKIDAVNIALSQRHRAAIYSGDPQMFETGVDDDAVRRPMVSGPPDAERDLTRDRSGYDAPLIDRPRQRGGGRTRVKKGTGTLWTYESPEAKLQYLTLGKEALASLDEDAKANLTQLREDLSHVHIDPKDLTGSGDISGKTLAFVFASQVAYCNRVRTDLWNGALLPVLSMLLRVVLKVESGLYLAGADKIRAVVKRFEQRVSGAAGDVWFDPPIKPLWGDYFEASDVDESTRIANAKLAKESGLITLETAVAHIKPIFGDIQNPAQYIEALKAEADEAQAKLHEAMAALGSGTQNAEPSEATSGAPGQGAPPAPVARGGRGAAAAARPRAKGPARGARAAA